MLFPSLQVVSASTPGLDVEAIVEGAPSRSLPAGRKLTCFRAVIRYYTAAGGWDLLSNQGQAHTPLNIVSVSSSALHVTVNYDESQLGANPEITSAWVVPDETLAKEGVYCGASIGGGQIIIDLTKRGLVDYIAYDGSFSSLTGEFNMSFASGKLTLTSVRDIVTEQVGATQAKFSMLSPRGTGVYVNADSQGNSGSKHMLEVLFLDPATGAQITTPNSDMKFFVHSPLMYRLNPNSDFPNQHGNLWLGLDVLSDA